MDRRLAARLDLVTVGFFWHDGGWVYYVGARWDGGPTLSGATYPGTAEAVPLHAEGALARFQIQLTAAFKGPTEEENI